MARKKQDNIQEQLLHHTLEQAVFDGWNNKALEKAAEILSLPQNSAYAYFPGGVDDVATFYHEFVSREMEELLAKKKLNEMKIRDRIRTAVLTRLDIYARHKEAVALLIKHYATPTHAFEGLGNVWNTVDLMWKAAGDNATDFNYYSKRMILSGVYTSTLWCWLSDSSEGLEKTHEFLDKRIENVMQFGKAKQKINDAISSFFTRAS